MHEVDEKVKSLIQPGTCRGKIAYGALFFVLGLLLVNHGVWKTLLVASLTAFGVVLGSAETLGKAVGKVLDFVVPSKKKVVYTPEDIEKVKKATQAKNEAREKAEEAADPAAVQEEQA